MSETSCVVPLHRAYTGQPFLLQLGEEAGVIGLCAFLARRVLGANWPLAIGTSTAGMFTAHRIVTGLVAHQLWQKHPHLPSPNPDRYSLLLTIGWIGALTGLAKWWGYDPLLGGSIASIIPMLQARIQATQRIAHFANASSRDEVQSDVTNQILQLNLRCSELENKINNWKTEEDRVACREALSKARTFANSLSQISVFNSEHRTALTNHLNTLDGLSKSCPAPSDPPAPVSDGANKGKPDSTGSSKRTPGGKKKIKAPAHVRRARRRRLQKRRAKVEYAFEELEPTERSRDLLIQSQALDKTKSEKKFPRGSRSDPGNSRGI